MVSIVIPVYNTAQYLSHTLDSVISQSYRNVQIICINDGSTDQSLSILEEYAKRDSRIEIISQHNSGLSAARNRGLETVKGDYVMFLDSDDWLDSDTVAKARTHLVSNDVDVVLWGYVKEYDNRSIPVQPWTQNIVFSAGDVEKLTYRLIGLTGRELRNPALLDSPGTVWGKLYKTALLMETNAKFADTNIIGSAEDVLYNIEVFSQATAVLYTTDIFYHYRKNNFTSFTKTYKKDLIIQWQNLFDCMHQLVIKYKMHESAKIALENRKALAIIGLGLNELDATSSFINQVKRIKSLLAIPWLHHALEQMPLSYFPIHWKLFFYLAKNTASFPLTVLLLIIKYLLAR